MCLGLWLSRAQHPQSDRSHPGTYMCVFDIALGLLLRVLRFFSYTMWQLLASPALFTEKWVECLVWWAWEPH